MAIDLIVRICGAEYRVYLWLFNKLRTIRGTPMISRITHLPDKDCRL